jgi:SET domain-containing protein
MRQSGLVLVKKVRGKGRGVFARRPIREGVVIEKVPVILVPIESIAEGWRNPILGCWCFVRNRRTVAIALGYGSLYNHSYRPNARYEEGPAATMIFTALRNIRAGEEITINYNGDTEDRGPVGFDVLE